MSTEVKNESNHIFLLLDSTMSSVINFCFTFCNLKEKDSIGRKISSKKKDLHVKSVSLF